MIIAGGVGMCDRYRSLSSVARELLPKAERMRRGGKAWRRIAEELGVSATTLHNWRKVGGKEG
jgi:DNA-binding Lrp family transcriptional regulator